MGRARKLGIGLMTLMALGAPFLPPPARAHEDAVVTGWVTLASATPATGCWVEATIEVRHDGGALTGVPVGLSLSGWEQSRSASEGVTGDDGIAYLGVDTSAVAPGTELWLDVVIAGGYAGGMPVTVMEGGGCAGNPRVVEVNGVAPVGGEAPVEAAWAAAPIAGPTNSVWVPAYVQQRNLSCEYAAMTIATSAWGAPVSEYAFDALVGWSANPHWGFRGDINGAWGNTVDYGVYPEALVDPLAQFGFAGTTFYGQGDASTLMAYLDAGVPVAVWLGLWGDQSFFDYADDGTPFKLTTGYHVVVAYGYDDAGIHISDPAKGSYAFYDWPTFMWMWNVLDGMALAVSPA